MSLRCLVFRSEHQQDSHNLAVARTGLSLAPPCVLTHDAALNQFRSTPPTNARCFPPSLIAEGGRCPLPRVLYFGHLGQRGVLTGVRCGGRGIRGPRGWGGRFRAYRGRGRVGVRKSKASELVTKNEGHGFEPAVMKTVFFREIDSSQLYAQQYTLTTNDRDNTPHLQNIKRSLFVKFARNLSLLRKIELRLFVPPFVPHHIPCIPCPLNCKRATKSTEEVKTLGEGTATRRMRSHLTCPRSCDRKPSPRFTFFCVCPAVVSTVIPILNPNPNLYLNVYVRQKYSD